MPSRVTRARTFCEDATQRMKKQDGVGHYLCRRWINSISVIIACGSEIRGDTKFLFKTLQVFKYFHHEKRNFLSPRDHVISIFFITILAKSSQYNKYSISSGVCLSLTSPQRPSLCQYAVAAKAKTDVKVEFGQKVFMMTWGHLEANSFSTTSSFRLSDVLGLFPSPLAFSSFCFALRVTIVGSFKHTTSVNVKL